jgi:hypothetical protein
MKIIRREEASLKDNGEDRRRIKRTAIKGNMGAFFFSLPLYQNSWGETEKHIALFVLNLIGWFLPEYEPIRTLAV